MIDRGHLPASAGTTHPETARPAPRRRLPQPPDGAVTAAGFVALPVTPLYPVRVDVARRTVTVTLRDEDEAAEATRLIASAQAAFAALPQPLPLAQAQPRSAALLEASQLRRAVREARHLLGGGDRLGALTILNAYACDCGAGEGRS